MHTHTHIKWKIQREQLLEQVIYLAAITILNKPNIDTLKMCGILDFRAHFSWNCNFNYASTLFDASVAVVDNNDDDGDTNYYYRCEWNVIDTGRTTTTTTTTALLLSTLTTLMWEWKYLKTSVKEIVFDSYSYIWHHFRCNEHFICEMWTSFTWNLFCILLFCFLSTNCMIFRWKAGNFALIYNTSAAHCVQCSTVYVVVHSCWCRWYLSHYMYQKINLNL